MYEFLNNILVLCFKVYINIETFPTYFCHSVLCLRFKHTDEDLIHLFELGYGIISYEQLTVRLPSPPLTVL